MFKRILFISLFAVSAIAVANDQLLPSLDDADIVNVRQTTVVTKAVPTTQRDLVNFYLITVDPSNARHEPSKPVKEYGRVLVGTFNQMKDAAILGSSTLVLRQANLAVNVGQLRSIAKQVIAKAGNSPYVLQYEITNASRGGPVNGWSDGEFTDVDQEIQAQVKGDGFQMLGTSHYNGGGTENEGLMSMEITTLKTTIK
jgi:hypothetical protein